jgi:hypothetical protein
MALRGPVLLLSSLTLLSACGSEAPPAGGGAAPTAPTLAAAPPTPATAPTPAAPPPPSGPPVDLLHATAASVAPSSAYQDDPDQVAALLDGSLETAWNSRTGELVGAYIEVRLPADATVTSIGLTAGFTHVSPRADLFPGNHRVTRVRVLHDGTEVGTYPLDPELRTLQSLPVTGGGGVYRVEIAEVLPGTRTDWQEACISELVVMGHAPEARAGSTVPRTAIGTLPPLPEPGTNAAPAREGDGVYLAVQDVGLVHLGASGHFRLVHEDEWVGLHRTPNGDWAMIAGTNGEYRIVRGAGAPIACPRTLGMVMGIAVLDDGSAWAVGGNGFGHYDGASWTVTPREGSASSFGDVVVDGEGTVWLLSERNGLHRIRDGQVIHEEVPGTATLVGMMRGPSGQLVVHHAAGVLERRGDGWTTWASGGVPAFRDDGVMALVVGYASASIVASPGAPPQPIPLGALGVPASHIQGATWDGARRLWLDTDVGVVVLEPELTLARWYPVGTVPLLDGSSTYHIVSVGAAPPLPDADPPVGHAHGTVVRRGAPLGDAWVEVCSHPSRSSGPDDPSPCDDGTDYVRSTTAADGTFEVFGLPSGTYEVAVQLGEGRWFVTSGLDCCDRPRELVELGTIDVGR